MTTILLAGPLGARFGRRWRLAVRSVAEAVHAIDCQLPGFRRAILAMQCKFIVRRNGELAISKEDLQLQSDLGTVSIVPVASGAGKGKGILGAILGAVLVVASLFIPGSAAFLGIALKGTVAMIGLSLAVGGIAQLLAGTPKSAEGKEPENTASYVFNGPANVVQQGGPIPLIYGRVITGCTIISASIESRDVEATSATSGSSSSNTGSGNPSLPVGVEEP
ncbi:MAG: tail assembly protein [Verrucomicrobia bacterium]|nr:tail assembly protein [Verrucomicrobiota bacterium]